VSSVAQDLTFSFSGFILWRVHLARFAHHRRPLVFTINVGQRISSSSLLIPPLDPVQLSWVWLFSSGFSSPMNFMPPQDSSFSLCSYSVQLHSLLGLFNLVAGACRLILGSCLKVSVSFLHEDSVLCSCCVRVGSGSCCRCCPVNLASLVLWCVGSVNILALFHSSSVGAVEFFYAWTEVSFPVPLL
jgi:hypothetical protein